MQETRGDFGFREPLKNNYSFILVKFNISFANVDFKAFFGNSSTNVYCLRANRKNSKQCRSVNNAVENTKINK